MSLEHSNQIFNSLDLSGNWQVPMAPDSRKMTAFSAPNGHFEWLHIPFGHKSAPIRFQRMNNTLFSSMLGSDVYAYLDNLLVCGKNIGSHLANLEAVLLLL